MSDTIDWSKVDWLKLVELEKDCESVEAGLPLNEEELKQIVDRKDTSSSSFSPK